MALPALPWRCDLFCRVIDHFGDAGVAWRLARLLVEEQGASVRLWIDAPARLGPLLGRATVPDDSVIDGITIRVSDRWHAAAGLPDVIVDVLGGGLPEACHSALRQTRKPPAWFILEYLTAEAWADDLHGKPSPDPRTGLPRRFWFPGFTARTGGLLRERGLVTARDAWAQDPAARAALLPQLAPGDGLTVSLFCYRNAPLGTLLDAWATGAEVVRCLLPHGVAREAIAAWAREPIDGRVIARGALRIEPIPFLPQPGYDRLLWSSDVNFVRGEDSFVRAQWAARPFVWNIYPQADAAHAAKLEAFLGRFTSGLPEDVAAATGELWRAWNGLLPAARLAAAWGDFRAARELLAAYGRRWSERLAGLPELAATLAAAARETV